MAKRLAAAFVLAALAAVGVLGGLTWMTTRSQLAELTAKRNAHTQRDVVSALAHAYRLVGSWDSADIRPARTVAVAAGATLTVYDAAGKPVVGAVGVHAAGFDGEAGAGGLYPTSREVMGRPRPAPVIVGGHRVGTAELRFPLSAPTAERTVRNAFRRTVLWGGALAGGLAVSIGFVVAHRISQSLRRLTAAARELQAGNRAARVGAASEPAELGELSVAFDRMAETIDEEDRLRRAFAADVAHELRTPVTILRGELEAVIDGVEEPSPQRLLSLHEEVLRLGRIVEDVETLAAAEAARFRLERRQIDLADVACEAVDALQPQADAAGIQLSVDSETACIKGDRARLDQVARNLLWNAIKFTPPGGRVAVLVSAANGDARLVVEDTGQGIPEDERSRLFDRFWRGRGAEGTSGSGIGLAVVAQLVAAHGGSVTADTPPSGGARFTVTLPRA